MAPFVLACVAGLEEQVVVVVVVVVMPVGGVTGLMTGPWA